MMIDALHLIVVMVQGAMLGAVFFGGLWWTVRKALTARHPALWIFGSMFLRIWIVLPGLYFISGASWLHLLAALLGFIAARLVVVRLTREMSPAGEMGQGVGHAP